MARIKVTSSDINAKLAKGECANYRNNSCQGRIPCMVLNGEPCQYFATYVKPLLDYPEISSKYGREAKIAVALNPKSKVVRKRRLAAEPTLAIKSAPPAALPAAPAKSQPPVKPAGKSPAVIAETPRPLPLAAARPGKLARESARMAKEVLSLPVQEPVTKAKKAAPPAPVAVPAPTPREKAPQPAAAAAPPRHAAKSVEPALTLSSAPPAPAPPAVKRGKATPNYTATTVAPPPLAPAPIITAKPRPEPEQPQLFGDLFAAPSPPRTSRKR